MKRWKSENGETQGKVNERERRTDYVNEVK